MLKRLLIAACTLLFAGSLLAATPAAKPHVLIATSLGEIEVELDPAKAPISVKNFLESTSTAATTTAPCSTA